MLTIREYAEMAGLDTMRTNDDGVMVEMSKDDLRWQYGEQYINYVTVSIMESRR